MIWGAPAAALLFAASVVAAYPAALRLVPGGRIAERWCALAIVVSWAATVGFYGLTALALFRLPVAAALILGLAALGVAGANRGETFGRLRADLRAAARLALRPANLPLAAVAAALLLVVGFRTMRSFVVPPMAWDAMTYHLLKAGRWVQQGAWVADAAPDAWGYYEYFPAGGDLLWAWAMLPAHADTWIGAAGLLAWSACALAAYGAARVLGAAASRAGATALAVAAMPCLASFVASAYVTGPWMAGILLGIVFLLRVRSSGRTSDAVLAVAAMALAAGIQASALPLLAVALLASAAALWRQRGAGVAVAGMALAALVCAPVLTSYARAWIEIGSPLYPLSLTVAGTTIWRGNRELAGVLSGTYLGARGTVEHPWAFVANLFAGGLTEPFHGARVGHLNLGVGALLLALPGLAGLWLLWRDRARRSVVPLLLAFVAIPVAALLPDTMRAQRTEFAWVAGRFLAPSVAMLALLGSVVPGRVAQAARLAAVGAGAVQALPVGVAAIEWRALADLAPWAAALLLVPAAAIAGRHTKRPGFVLAVAAAAAGVVFGAGVQATRDRYRYPMYRAAASDPAPVPYDLVPLAQPLVAWPIWQAVDEGAPHRIAFAAGWDGFAGHTWFRYPLLGSRLQNTVIYVPPTRSGASVDYRRLDRLAPQADPAAWVRRLLDRGVDVVIVGPPDVPELAWLRAHPAAFTPFGPTSPWPITLAFRVHAAEARALLDTLDEEAPTQ